MNVNVVVTVGSFVCEVTVTDTDILAVGDLLHEVAVHTLSMVGADAVYAAAYAVTMEGGGGDVQA